MLNCLMTVWIRSFILLLALLPPLANAWDYRSLPSFSESVLSDTTPFVFNPSTLTENDFVWKFFPNEFAQKNKPNLKVEMSLVPGSFQWVRANILHLLPRARLMVNSSEPLQFQVSTARFGGTNETQLLVSLVNEEAAAVKVYAADGKTELGVLRGQFKATQIPEANFISDSSCSPQRVYASKNGLKRSWMHVGCRVIHATSDSGDHPVLELFVYWDLSEQKNTRDNLTVEMNGARIPELRESFYVIRVDSNSGPVSLSAKSPLGEESVTISYSVPNRFHNLGVSGGIGPYRFRASGGTPGGKDIDQIAPLGTLYFSYFLNEGFKLASFWMFPVSNAFKVDAGFFVVLEQFRGIDQRVSLNLLIGMQFLQLFPAKFFQFDAMFAQGIELTFRDFFIKGYDASIGGFFYPKITNEGYINTWARFGRGSWFIELNYVTWELVSQSSVYTNNALGLSVGFPIGRFL